MSTNDLLELNTGTPEPSGSAPMLDSGVALPNSVPTLLLSTHSMMFVLISCSLFEFGQSLPAITEASRGGQTYRGLWQDHLKN